MCVSSGLSRSPFLASRACEFNSLAICEARVELLRAGSACGRRTSPNASLAWADDGQAVCLLSVVEVDVPRAAAQDSPA
eukprot:12412466-Alexandrium_andersonii.AAC.1